MLGWSEGGTAGQYVALETLACQYIQKEKEGGVGQHKKLQEQ